MNGCRGKNTFFKQKTSRIKSTMETSVFCEDVHGVVTAGLYAPPVSWVNVFYLPTPFKNIGHDVVYKNLAVVVTNTHDEKTVSVDFSQGLFEAVGLSCPMHLMISEDERCSHDLPPKCTRVIDLDCQELASGIDGVLVSQLRTIIPICISFIHGQCVDECVDVSLIVRRVDVVVAFPPRDVPLGIGIVTYFSSNEVLCHGWSNTIQAPDKKHLYVRITQDFDPDADADTDTDTDPGVIPFFPFFPSLPSSEEDHDDFDIAGVRVRVGDEEYELENVHERPSDSFFRLVKRTHEEMDDTDDVTRSFMYDRSRGVFCPVAPDAEDNTVRIGVSNLTTRNSLHIDIFSCYHGQIFLTT